MRNFFIQRVFEIFHPEGVEDTTLLAIFKARIDKYLISGAKGYGDWVGKWSWKPHDHIEWLSRLNGQYGILLIFFVLLQSYPLKPDEMRLCHLFQDFFYLVEASRSKEQNEEYCQNFNQ